MFGRIMVVSAALLAAAAAAHAQSGCLTTRESVSAAGEQGNGYATRPHASADGRFVAFHSAASSLVPGDLNGEVDAFVRDRLLRTTVRVSVGPGGAGGDDESTEVTVSNDGRRAAFQSRATDLIAGDTNGLEDVFLRDLEAGTTVRACVGLGGAEPDGRSTAAMVSGDGRYVLFTSSATNLVAGDINGFRDVFLWDSQTGGTVLVSQSTAGAQGDQFSIAEDITHGGRYATFDSYATNLVPGDTNKHEDVFLRDLVAGTTTRVSVGENGEQGNEASWKSSISDDGRYVVFRTGSRTFKPDINGVLDIFLRDLLAGTTELVSLSSSGQQADDFSDDPSISADGRYVAFHSAATDLVAGDINDMLDVFVRDLAAGVTTRVSVDSLGVEGNGDSSSGVVSNDGSVAFVSFATNLVPGDTNNVQDIFVRDCPPPPTTYCSAKASSLGCVPAVSTSGTPTESVTAPFLVECTEIINGQAGILFYGLSGSKDTPFQGGTMCVAPPRFRTPLQGSGGNPPPAADCSGSFSFDFNAEIWSGKNPALAAGVQVNAQYWYRDPGSASATGLSDAVELTILP